MHNRLFLGFMILLLPMLAGAQVHRSYTQPERVWQIMPKGGWQYHSFSGSSQPTSYQAGWVAGIALKMPLLGSIWLQPEALYSRRSAGLQYPAIGSKPAYEAAYSFGSLEMPVLLVYRPNDIIELHLGPQASLLLSNDSQASDGQPGPRLSPAELRKWDYAVSAGLELNMSPLAFGARYSYGLLELAKTEVAKSSLGGARLQGFQLYGALVF